MGLCLALLSRQSRTLVASELVFEKVANQLTCRSWDLAAQNVLGALKEKGLRTTRKPGTRQDCHLENTRVRPSLESDGSKGIWNYRYKRKQQKGFSKSSFFAPLLLVFTSMEFSRSLKNRAMRHRKKLKRLNHRQSLVELFYQKNSTNILARFDYQRSNAWLDLLCNPDVIPLTPASVQKCNKQ